MNDNLFKHIANLSTYDKMYPVVLSGCYACPDRKEHYEIRIRNVSDKRAADGQHAHFEISLMSEFKRTTRRESRSVPINRAAAEAICRELMPELIDRAAVAELIEACRERDDANAAWNCLEGERRQYPGPEYQRARAADARYEAALARVSA